MTYPAAPRVACSWAPTNQTGYLLTGQAWMVGTAMTRYVPLAVQTTSSMDQAMTSSTGVTVTMIWSQTVATTSSMAGMATISFIPMMMGGTSSIAVLAGTNTLLTRTTMWIAAARRSSSHRGIAALHIGG